MAQDEDRALKRGRPRGPEPKATVSTWLPAREYDRLIALARVNRASVSAVVRLAVRRHMRAFPSCTNPPES